MFKSNRFPSEEALPLIGGKNYETDYGVEILPPERTKFKYPRAVVFVLVAKFFEAFAANGIRTILALYLRDDLYFTESLSIVMLHIFNFFGQFCPIFGAVLADNYIGNTRTISYFCILYGVGWFGFILTSFPSIGLPLVFLVSVSLLLISIGNGSIRACLTSLGALQFKVPEQSHLLTAYFSHYYFIYYMGIFLSKIVPPMIRANTTCFGKIGCYPAVFGILGAAFLASWVIFIVGKLYYKDEELSDDNVLVRFYRCVKHALIARFKTPHVRHANWLHHSIPNYGRDFVNDVWTVLKISKLFIPLPVYYALLAQQDSSWTFQATQMDTTIFGMKIEPDQAKAMGPIFLFSLIPVWQYIVLPILRHFNKEVQPLQSMAIGGLCSALSFICAGALELSIKSYPYKTVNIAWQIPQFLLLMMGELFLSIPGLQFAFTQAPISMKSVLTAAWFLNNAFGNLIVVVITELNPFGVQSSEYFFYAILMFLSVAVFVILAFDYMREMERYEEDELKRKPQCVA